MTSSEAPPGEDKVKTENQNEIQKSLKELRVELTPIEIKSLAADNSFKNYLRIHLAHVQRTKQAIKKIKKLTKKVKKK